MLVLVLTAGVFMSMLVPQGHVKAANTWAVPDDALEQLHAGSPSHTLAIAAAAAAINVPALRPLRVGFTRSPGVRMDADDEEDWVRARVEAENRDFHGKREQARMARIAAWEEEVRVLRAEEARRAETKGHGGSDLQPSSAEGSEEPPNQIVAEYEARMSKLVGGPARQTAEEKQEAYHKELLRQIEQADAMDERLRQKNLELRRAKGLI
jgi:hypothetical protein